MDEKDIKPFDSKAFPNVGAHIYSNPYMHADRFYSMPSVQREDFCMTPFLRKEWKLFQEIKSFKGLFQYMIELNFFQYWGEMEKNIWGEGFHPKGFSLVEFIKWNSYNTACLKLYFSLLYWQNKT